MHDSYSAEGEPLQETGENTSPTGNARKLHEMWKADPRRHPARAIHGRRASDAWLNFDQVASEIKGPEDDHTRARKRLNQRVCRERKRARLAAEAAEQLAVISEVLDDLPDTSATLDREIVKREFRAFRKWLAIDGPEQRQHRPRRQEIMASRIVLLRAREQLDGDDPGYGQFAADLNARPSQALARVFTKSAARQRLALLKRFEQPGGPWHPGDIKGATLLPPGDT